MKTDFYTEISHNKWRTFFLLFFFSFIIILLGWVFSVALGGSAYIGMFFAFIIAIIFGLIGYYTGDKTVLAISKAKPVTHKDDPFLWNTVEGLAIAAGIPMPKLYLIEETSINAFATGRDPQHASIAVTSGARKRLNRTELEGVIAHEMSHIKNYDIRYMVLVAVLVGFVALFSDFMLRTFLWGGGNRDRDRGGIGIIFILLAIVLAILAPLIAQLIKFSISRKREYLADASGAMLTRYPAGLANALKKIRDDHDKVVDTANKATAHLYIENPLRNIKGAFNSMFSTHPDINDRIKRLEGM
ncbi:MAG: M48 family metallopeptidase [Nanoarchaeota archaeon]